MFEQAAHSAGANWKLWLSLATAAMGLLGAAIWVWRMTWMPLESYGGALAPLSPEQTEMSRRLSRHVRYLSQTIGERNLERAGSLQAAANYIGSELEEAGYSVTEQVYSVQGTAVRNLEAKLTGSDAGSGTVVVGAHYDSVFGSPGANDNGSGVAAVLELAQVFRSFKPRKSIRFVLFVNEEPPYFQTGMMGSVVYARQLRREQVAVVGMISLETIGYYSDAPGSQHYPPLLGRLYPNRGNFIGFVANPGSGTLLRRVVKKFRETTEFPSEGVAAPENLPGIGWSDQWSFWQEQYPAIMVTDTAPFRYPYYHTASDRIEHMDIGRMTRVVDGLRRVLESLAMGE